MFDGIVMYEVVLKRYQQLLVRHFFWIAATGNQKKTQRRPWHEYRTVQYHGTAVPVATVDSQRPQKKRYLENDGF